MDQADRVGFHGFPEVLALQAVETTFGLSP